MDFLKIREIELWETLTDEPFEAMGQFVADFNLVEQVKKVLKALNDKDLGRLIGGEAAKVEGWDDPKEINNIISELITSAVVAKKTTPQSVRRYIETEYSNEFFNKNKKYKKLIYTLWFIYAKRFNTDLTWEAWQEKTLKEAQLIGEEAQKKITKELGDVVE